MSVRSIVMKCRKVDWISSRLFRINETSSRKTVINLGRIIKR
jgi:hypothetical protein